MMRLAWVFWWQSLACLMALCFTQDVRWAFGMVVFFLLSYAAATR